MESSDKHIVDAKQEREKPRLLRVLCLLSFGYGIFMVFMSLLSALSGAGSTNVERMASADIQQFPEMEMDILQFWEHFHLNYVGNNLCYAVLFAAGLIGVYEMFNLRKRGFFMYGLSHILITFYPILMVYHNDFSEWMAFQSGMFTLLFVGLYATTLKHME